MASNGIHSAIPNVDISAFTTGGDLESRRRTARELATACHPHGCVSLTGHGVPPELLRETFTVTKRLFDLPLEDKMKAPHPDGYIPHRGYSGIGKEQASGKASVETNDEVHKKVLKSIKDYKESFEVGSEENLEQYNIWLPDDVLPGFRPFATNLFWELTKTSMAILDAFIISIDLNQQEAESLRKLHSGHNNQVRFLHYPPIPSEALANKDLSRFFAHTDWSSFTFVFQDACGGLEFLNRETNEFMPAIPKGDMLYLNIGEMLTRISNGFYPAAKHRVVIPDSDTKSTPPRYSIPYFVVPDADGIVFPQPSRIIADKAALYEPIVFREFAAVNAKATYPDEGSDKS